MNTLQNKYSLKYGYRLTPGNGCCYAAITFARRHCYGKNSAHGKRIVWRVDRYLELGRFQNKAAAKAAAINWMTKALDTP